MITIQQKKNLLIQIAFWFCILAFVYCFFEYLLPMIFPFMAGFGVAYGVVRLADRIRPGCRWLRMILAVVIYGSLGAVLVLLSLKAGTGVSNLVSWLPRFYEMKLAPVAEAIHDWSEGWIRQFDPSLSQSLEVFSGSLMSAFHNLFASVSGFAVNLLSDLVTAVPSGVVSALAMIISTFFVAADYEKITAFLADNMPQKGAELLDSIRRYLTETLFVVIRSYLIIMLLTFTELAILFTLFRIDHALSKAALIAMLDILPILGTGSILIPWAVTSLILGYTGLGLKLLVTYSIVAVIRNYVEPKIVGAQLGLHPIITLVSMFVGLRLFGFWGMFGIPVSISYFWKQKKGRSAVCKAVNS